MRLETTNPRICLFYKENPSLNFDSVNILFIELFEKILHNLNHTMSVTLQTQISNNVNEIKSSIQNIQQPIYTYLNNSEEKFKEYTNNTQSLQLKWVTEMKNLLNDVKTTTSVSTNPTHIQSILNKMYNTAEIYDIKYSLFPRYSPTTDIYSNMNYYLMKRNNRHKIFIQSADLSNNITTEDIQSFIENMQQNQSHGIFLSQNSGIANKTNYQIEIYNNMLCIYVHNAEYSPDKIHTAVDIIDHLSVKLTELKKDNETDILISKDILDEINTEYQTFISQKEMITNVLKDQHKRALSLLDEMKIPSLDKFLSTKFAVHSQKPGLKCDLCKLFNANNLKALAAHKRGCNRKIQNNTHPSQNHVINGLVGLGPN